MDFTKFKHVIFDTPEDLAAYVVTNGATISSIVEILSDASGKYILFYLTT